MRPPHWLNKTAKAYWRSIAPALTDAGILNPATSELVATGCNAYSVYREATETLAAEGRIITTHTGAKKMNPLVAVEKNAFEQLVRVFKELGISDKHVKDPRDTLSEFLGKND